MRLSNWRHIFNPLQRGAFTLSEEQRLAPHRQRRQTLLTRSSSAIITFMPSWL
jgi:hypothetical protein